MIFYTLLSTAPGKRRIGRPVLIYSFLVFLYFDGPQIKTYYMSWFSISPELLKQAASSRCSRHFEILSILKLLP